MLRARKPNSKEQAEIGETVRVSRTTVNLVLNKLSEHGLFTKELGSIPLYMATKKIEVRESLGALSGRTVRALPLTETVAEETKYSFEMPESQEVQTLKPLKPAVKPLMQASQASRADLERRLEGFEESLKVQDQRNEAQFLEVKEMISRLSFDSGGGNPNKVSNPNPTHDRARSALSKIKGA